MKSRYLGFHMETAAVAAVAAVVEVAKVHLYIFKELY
jgi:nucleoside phosphorylase